MAVFGSPRDGVKSISSLYLFFIYCLVLIAGLVVMKFMAYSDELILWIAAICFVSGVIMCVLAEILLRLLSSTSKEKPEAQPAPEAKPAVEESANGRDGWLNAGYAIALLCVSVLLLIWFLRNIKPLPGPDIDKTLETINQRTSLLEVQRSHLVFVQPDRSKSPGSLKQMSISLLPGEFSGALDEQPDLQFVIMPKDKKLQDCVFPVREYIMNDDGNIPTAGICEAIDSIYSDDKIPLLESIKELPVELSAPVKMVDVSAPIFELAVDLFYIIRTLYRMANSRVEILAKGYADGQFYEWQKPLKPGYEYQHFSMYRALYPDSAYQVEYIHSEVPVDIPELYDNRHLPELRAKFVEQKLITPFLKRCNNLGTIETHILQGNRYSERNSLRRKVEIYMLLF